MRVAATRIRFTEDHSAAEPGIPYKVQGTWNVENAMVSRTATAVQIAPGRPRVHLTEMSHRDRNHAQDGIPRQISSHREGFRGRETDRGGLSARYPWISVPVGSPGKKSVPVGSPGKIFFPAGSPGQQFVPVGSPGQESVPPGSPGKISVPVNPPGQIPVRMNPPGQIPIPVYPP